MKIIIILGLILMLGVDITLSIIFGIKTTNLKKLKTDREEMLLIYATYDNDDKKEEINKNIKQLKNKVKKNKVNLILGILLSFVSLVLLIFIPGSIHQINAGQVAVVKIWGDAKEVRTAGIHYDNWISHKYEIYNTTVQQIPIQTSAYSSDSQPMDIQLYIQYQIQQENAIKIATNYGNLEMLESRIETIAIERMKSVLSKYKAEELIQKRGTISPEVEVEIRTAITSDFYVNIGTVVLTNIDFSDAFEKSVEDKMIAEQEKLKAEYENQKAIAKAEADLKIAQQEAQAMLEKAKQEALAQKELADAKAYEQTTLAEAEKEASEKIQVVWNSIDAETKNAMLQKLAIEQWNGILPETMYGDNFLQWLLGNISNKNGQ